MNRLVIAGNCILLSLLVSNVSFADSTSTICGSLKRYTPSQGPQVELNEIHTDSDTVGVIFDLGGDDNGRTADPLGSVYSLMENGKNYCVTGVVNIYDGQRGINDISRVVPN
ncbi:MAG: hypothetical protein NTV34_05510 [Proteobacteria bacterium]|nr:hypothetical protein [Pseudomonadota bacterium]